ncbi:RagB/SusD family nutrient uptake outer membrane protein [Hymenobacter psoromatis]|uniref:RagB/SusD family nutrient uptake outer membrane protein n=1 Tax=Hymenobacter psoromatis TaxID=1484116 RepID=UPI001CBB0818|nr:RagB/SusD family nutrient uptake outer membrane protein [Hymenobacter psoromatis]
MSLGGATRRKAFTATLGLGLLLGACNVTNVVPQDALSETAVYTDPARIALAVTGVYNAAQVGFYNGTSGGGRGYPFGAASTDLGDARGEDVTDMAGFFGIVFRNNITANSPNIVYMWANCYALINQANVTIEGIQQAATAGVIPAATEAGYEGEMRFLRALAHMELVINFSKPYTDGNGNNAGVPYRDTPINTPEALGAAGLVGRGLVSDVYTKMLADLDFAEANLSSDAGALKTHATKAAAIALKQRLHIYQGDWAGAITEGNKLISGTSTFTSPINGLVLMPTQRSAFVGAGTTNESIFSIENSNISNPGVNGAIPNVFGSASTPTDSIPGINGRSLLGVSPILYNAPFFTCNDLRRTEMMQQDGVRPCYVIRKYLDAATSTDYNPIMRYAEVLLNQAEAQARSGNDAQGLALLNAVRNRSVAATDQYAAGSLTGTKLVQAILNERRIEFVGEGLRWGDISRLATDPVYAPIPGGGIPGKLNGQASQFTIASYICGAGATPKLAAVPYKGAANSTLFLWPIPSTETQINPTLAGQQNPGY